MAFKSFLCCCATDTVNSQKDQTLPSVIDKPGPLNKNCKNLTKATTLSSIEENKIKQTNESQSTKQKLLLEINTVKQSGKRTIPFYRFSLCSQKMYLRLSNGPKLYNFWSNSKIEMV